VARKPPHEEHQNHEAWAIPYADLVTLLLAFFVVMYAISSVNEGKYRVLSDALVSAFRGTPMTVEPIQVGEKQRGSGADLKTSVVQEATLAGQPRSMLEPVPLKTGLPKSDGTGLGLGNASEAAQRATRSAKALSHVADEVEHAMDDMVKANLVLVRRNDFWIEVEIRTDILFPSGSAQLSPNAVGVIERLGNALAPFPNAIRVEGHTDNRPIKTVAFISNWELSAARAGSVVRVLASRSVDPGRLAVIGYGENRPTHGNDTAEGRNANRRVVVVILSVDSAKDSNPAMAAAADAASSEGAPGAATLSTRAGGAIATPAGGAMAVQANSAIAGQASSAIEAAGAALAAQSGGVTPTAVSALGAVQATGAPPLPHPAGTEPAP
jgi:chemotaxis protein MotB